MRYLKYILVVAASLALFACGNKSTSTGTGVISLNGGKGGTAAGGNGGAITTFSHSTSMVHGDLKFHAAGTVNAGFTLPSLIPNFVNVSTSTTVVKTITINTPVTVGSAAVGGFFILSTDNNLYFQTTSGPKRVSGLIVNAALHLPNDNGFTLISDGIVINGGGTVTSDGANLDLRSGALLQINPGGVVQTTTATGAGGSLALTSTSGVVINQGTVNGSGVSGGASGGVTLHAATFLYNTGIINAKGGNSDTGAGGAGGAVQLLADAASVSTSGAIDSSGGNGSTGGAAGAITASGGASPSAVGRVSVEGTVTGNGGNGTSGDGGVGADISLTSFSGGVLIAATISANGGTSTGGNGGAGGSLQLDNKFGNDNAALHQVSPEGIKVAGNISLNGGQGSGQGGAGGRVSVASDTVGDSLPGFGNVEFFGYQGITLNGGTSTSGAGGDGGTVTCGISSPAPIVGVFIPAGGVFNEVAITARGGDNSPASAAKTAGGGNGGSVVFTTPQTVGEATDPARTLVTSSGGIDISGGAGTAGGAGGTMSMSGYGNVTISGAITSRGGTGTTLGGAGSASISLFSSSNVVSSGGIVVIGGDGINGGIGGDGGTVILKSGNQTSTAGIAANGGNSNAGTNPATIGGKGGTIVLSSEYALTLRSSLNVARGSGGSSNNAANGTITIDGVLMPTALPASGAI